MRLTLVPSFLLHATMFMPIAAPSRRQDAFPLCSMISRRCPAARRFCLLMPRTAADGNRYTSNGEANVQAPNDAPRPAARELKAPILAMRVMFFMLRNAVSAAF